MFPLSKIETSTENGTKIETVKGFAEISISEDSGLPDSRFLGVPRFFIILVVVVGGTFLWASMKTQVDEIKWKAQLVGIGCVVYGLAAAVDALVAESVIVISLVRPTLITAFLIIYLGYAMPRWLRTQLGLPTE